MALPPLSRLGAALRSLRRRAGLQQQQLAARAGVTRPMLSNYERGKTIPNVRTLWRVLDALGASLADLEDVMGERDSVQRLARWLLDQYD